MIKKLAILTGLAAVLAGCSGDGNDVELGTGGNRFAGEYAGTYTLPGQRDTTKDLIATIHSNGEIRGSVDGGEGTFSGTLNATNGAYTLRFVLPNLAPFTDTGTLTVRPDGTIGGTGTATPVVGGGAQQTTIDLEEDER